MIYVLVILFALSLAVSLFATYLMIGLGYRCSVVDQPDCRKLHHKAVPRLGGVAIILTIGLLFSVVIEVIEDFRVDPPFSSLLTGSVFICLIGLLDDLKNLRARTKLCCQFVAACYVCSQGICLNHLPLISLPEPVDKMVCSLITVIWVIGLTNAVNLTDGLDGLAAGIGTIASACMAVLAIQTGQMNESLVMILLCGALAGFLFYNFNPARIFLGDSGSLTLGFILACVSVQIVNTCQSGCSVCAPILILIIPILDTFSVMLRRFIEGRSVFSPDRNHFHHKLLAAGLTVRQAVIAAYLITGLTSGLALLGRWGDPLYAGIMFMMGVACVLYILHQVNALRIPDSIRGLLKRICQVAQIRKEYHSRDTLELYFQQAKTLAQWWKAACKTAHILNFESMRFHIQDTDPNAGILNWQSPCHFGKGNAKMTLQFPVLDRQTGLRHQLMVTIVASDGYERYGRSITMFSRLIDRYGFVHETSLEQLMIQGIVQKSVETETVEVAI